MKKTVVYRIAILLFILGGTIHAQTSSIIKIDTLQDDLNTLFGEIGKEVVPFIQENAIAGNSMGEAEISDGQHFFLSLITGSITASDGIGKFLEKGKVNWRFNLIDIPTEVNKLIGSNEYVAVTKTLFGFPSVNLGTGFKLPGGFEILVNGFYIPNSLVTWVIDLVETDKAGPIHTLAPTCDILNIGGMLRKSIISEKPNSLRPALSVGLGYTYGSFAAGISQFSQATPLPAPISTDLTLSGNFSIQTRVHTVGMELHTSKRLLIFTPFMKLGAWYHNSTFTTSGTLTAKAKDPVDSTKDLVNQALEIKVNPSISDISVLFTAGMELKLLILVISPSVTINLQNPNIKLENLAEWQKFMLKGVTGRVGVRLQL